MTILHRGPRPLDGFDPDLVGLLLRRTRELGVHVELEIDVLGIEQSAGGVAVRGRQRGGAALRRAAGCSRRRPRVPEIDDLDLATAPASPARSAA